jgi:hypothetical protein
MVKLTDGMTCVHNSSGAGSAGGKRISYRCEVSGAAEDDVVLLGELRPGEVWMAERAVVDAGRIRDAEWVSVQTIVQGPAKRIVPTIETDASASEAHVSTPAPESTLAATATSQPEASTGQARTSTPAPTTAPARPERVEFGLGATSTTIETTLEAGEVKTYVFRAMEGQTLLADVISPDENVQLSVYAAEPTVALEPQRVTATSWVGKLPESRDYLVELTAYGEAPHCTLQVVIPKVIQLESGAATVSLRSNINAGYVLDYIVHANAGQTLTAVISSPDDDVLLSLHGLDDGIPLVRATADATAWTGEVPATQDYLLKAVSTGKTTQYRLILELK